MIFGEKSCIDLWGKSMLGKAATTLAKQFDAIRHSSSRKSLSISSPIHDRGKLRFPPRSAKSCHLSQVFWFLPVIWHMNWIFHCVLRCFDVLVVLCEPSPTWLANDLEQLAVLPVLLREWKVSQRQARNFFGSQLFEATAVIWVRVASPK